MKKDNQNNSSLQIFNNELEENAVCAKFAHTNYISDFDREVKKILEQGKNKKG